MNCDGQLRRFLVRFFQIVGSPLIVFAFFQVGRTEDVKTLIAIPVVPISLALGLTTTITRRLTCRL